tara:strand:- start:1333 stop:1470 length:138 start_codon:yes stop_codon:yes gene_type:complete
MGLCQDKKRMREAIARKRKKEALKKIIEEKNAKLLSSEIINKNKI